MFDKNWRHNKGVGTLKELTRTLHSTNTTCGLVAEISIRLCHFVIQRQSVVVSNHKFTNTFWSKTLISEWLTRTLSFKPYPSQESG